MTPATTTAGERGWQPIETAPDFQTIDIWITALEGEGWRITGQIYSSQAPMWIKTEDGRDYFAHENGGWPTHWMLLPTPPLTPALGGDGEEE